MTYQEVQDKLAKVEYALSALQSGNHAQYTPEAVATKQEQLQTLKESLEEKLRVLKEEEGTVTTDDPNQAEKLSKKGANVKLVDKLDEGEEQMFDLNQTKLLAKQVAKAVIGGLKDLGDEVSRAVIKNVEPCDFTIYVEYKDGDDDEFVFYCKGDKLHLIDFTFDKEICEVGVKPSGEPILQVDVCKSALKTHWKSMNELHEGLSASEIEKIKLLQQFSKGERDDLPDPDSDAYKREKIAKMMSKQVSAEEVEYADDNDAPATDAKGENLSIGDVIEYEGKVYQIRYSYSKGRAHLETTDDRGNDNYGEEGYEKIEGEDPRFAEIVKNSMKVNSYAATKGGFMSEGEGDDHHYIKVPRSEFKKAEAIIAQNIDGNNVKMDYVDNDGAGNVIIYFMFKSDDIISGEADSFMYDAVMDLEAHGITLSDHSAELDENVTQKHIDDIEASGNIDIAYKKAMELLKSMIAKNENAKEDHDGKAAPYGSGFEKVSEAAQYTREIAEKIIELIRSTGVAPSDILNAIRKEFGTSIKEGTELYDKNGFQFKRFAGPNGLAMQITTRKLKGFGFDYIQIDGSRLGEFISGLSQSIRVFDDMSRQTPVDEEIADTEIPDSIKGSATKLQDMLATIKDKMKHFGKMHKEKGPDHIFKSATGEENSVIDILRFLNKKKDQVEKALVKAAGNIGKNQELNEYTDTSFTGAELIDNVSKNSPDMFAKQVFSDIVPMGVASEDDAVKALQAHDKSGIKQRMGSRYAPMFVHVQYHEFEHEGEKYRLHQTQYYNSNFKDKDPDFNPRVTQLILLKITKSAEDRFDREESENLGSILVKTDEYIKDLDKLDISKRAMEEGDYKSDAQRKAIYATKAEKEKKNEDKLPDGFHSKEDLDQFLKDNPFDSEGYKKLSIAQKQDILSYLNRDTEKEFARRKSMRGKKNEEKRPDYPDVDKDGDREESMEKALKDKEKNEKKRSK